MNNEDRRDIKAAVRDGAKEAVKNLVTAGIFTTEQMRKLVTGAGAASPVERQRKRRR